MRFLAEDGKLFNTEEECKEYEAILKKRKQDEEKNKEQENDLKNITEMMAEVTELMDKVNKATEAYEKKWGVSFGNNKIRLEKKNDDLSSLLKFLI